MRILSVEDDPVLGQAVRDQIVADGHSADWVTRIADADGAMNSAVTNPARTIIGSRFMIASLSERCEVSSTPGDRQIRPRTGFHARILSRWGVSGR